jgi:hypothetical protein
MKYTQLIQVSLKACNRTCGAAPIMEMLAPDYNLALRGRRIVIRRKVAAGLFSEEAPCGIPHKRALKICQRIERI